MEIPFTQYLMPDGRTKPVTIDRPAEIAEKAQALIDDGCRFEIEMLTTGEISMTVERDRDDGEIDLLAMKVCRNGPDVPANVDALVIEAAHTQ